MKSNSAPSIVVFDVNETLLDIEYLMPLFQRLFGAGEVMREWFAQMILYAQAITLAGSYTQFGTLGAGILRMLGDIHEVAIQDADIEELRTRMHSMPAHADVPDALRRLREAGFRLVTLTNSAPDPLADPLRRAGIADWFEQNFSVDRVRRFKPAPETYRMVAETLNVTTDALCLVAAHAWDTLGAQKAGCAAALITRRDNAILPIPELPRPEIVAPDLASVVDHIIRRWR